MNRFLLVILFLFFALGAFAMGQKAVVNLDEYLLSNTKSGYTNVMVEDMVFSWKLQGQDIFVKIFAPLEGWLAIGFDPAEKMKGADYIIGIISNGAPMINEHYGDNPYGHKSIVLLGGKDLTGNKEGLENKDGTMIGFSIPQDPQDNFHKKLLPGSTHKVILAYGADKNMKARHAKRYIIEIKL
jgi:hypothetical protein